MSGEGKEISFFKQEEIEEFDDAKDVKQDAQKIKNTLKVKNMIIYGLLATGMAIAVGLLSLVGSTTSSNYIKTNKVLISELFSSDTNSNSSFKMLEENIFLNLQKKETNTKVSFANDNLLALETSHYSHINVRNMGSNLYKLEYSNLSNAEYKWTNDYFQKENLPGLNIQKVTDPKNNELSVYISNAPIYLIGSTVIYPPISKPQYPVISQSNDTLPSLPLPELKDNIASPLDTPASRLQEQMTELRSKSISDTMKGTPVYNQSLPKPIKPLSLPPDMNGKDLNEIINQIEHVQKQVSMNDVKNDFEKVIPQHNRQEQNAKTVTQLRQQLEKNFNTHMMEKIK